MSKIMEEYGDEREAEGRRAGEKLGRAEGEKAGMLCGKLAAYFDLIKSGLLSVKDAAAKLEMSEDALLQQMAACLRENRIPFEIKADPFWSEENQERLRESIKQIKEGKFSQHDLIEG